LLSRLTLAFFAASIAIAVAACSSYGSSTVGGNGVGPSFPSQTLYAASSNQNSIDIYTKGQKSGTGPAYRIGGATTTLNGPQYIALDSKKNLWVTNYNTSTGAAVLVEIAALATGNVLPLASIPLTGRPRGIAITPKSSAAPTYTPAAVGVRPAATSSASASPSPSPSPKIHSEIIVMSAVVPTAFYPNQLQLWLEGATGPYDTIAGPNPNLNVPGGVALDENNNIYVTEVQGQRVDKFILPTPSPTPKPTPTPKTTPTPSASPSTSPSTSPSPSASPSPSPTPINVRPTFSITGKNTHVFVPTSVALDHAGNVYVADQGAAHAKCGSNSAPAILIFAHPRVKGIGNIISSPPAHIISGCATQLNAPTDIKVDSQGLIYVADTTQSGSGVVYIFAPGKYGNAASMGFYTSGGNVSGLIVVP
jgi:hypothetical protein